MNRKLITAAIAAISTAQISVDLHAAVELEEVVVTAQRRAESLQDAAIAIDAVTGEGLMKSGVTNAYELSKVVPALQITNGGGGASALYMRGVGNRTSSAYIDPAIAMSYDGVFLGRASGASSSVFYDLERVEVLKGPQGTLYGRNATGGAVNILPAKPVLGEQSGFFNATVGNIDSVQVQGAVNIPIGDNNALRLSANKQKRDGYNDDGTGDTDNYGIRAQFLSQVNDDLTVRIGADYTDVGGVGAGTTYTGVYSKNGLGDYSLVPSGLDIDEGMNTAAGNAYRNTVLGAPGFGFLTDIQDDWYVDNQYKGINAEITYAFKAGDLTIVPAWRKVEQDSKFGVPGFNSGWFQETDEQKSLEIRFAGETEGAFEYIVGAYYIDETIEGDNTFNQEFVLPMQEFKQDSESWATFGQATWHLTENTRLVTGVRYTDDKKTMQGKIDNYITFCGGPGGDLITPPDSFAAGCATPGNLPIYPTLDNVAQADAFLTDNGWAAAFVDVGGGVTVIPLTTGVGTVLHVNNTTDDSYQKSKTTYRVAFEWDLMEDSMVYLSYETGYRSGGFQLAAAPTYDPEYLDAITLGSKNRFLDGALQLNIEAFYWDYKDQQISYFTISDGVLENLTDNVGSATSKGIDIDLKWAAAENTLVTAKAQYLKASYDDLHFQAAPPRDNINCPSTVIGTTADGAPMLDFDCSGNESVFSPELTLILGVTQTIPVSDYNLIIALNSRWVDDQVSGFWNLEHEKIESYTTTDLDITFEPQSGDWFLSAYARNLEDERRISSTQASPIGLAMTQYGAPLTYGLRFGYNF
ncbi:TonB-dependent receptor [Aestuariicella hydrocarbonica]|uniref:TonB-dependent receptor n=1 Tax=Pseudomaricurvus hydrocarbonicus TaxID=1470433 RepID=A0A9E5JXP9_9GAMM|nr:TonB-dependent receptor [Aestuariicella hydrocarbonica]NHO66880.1 TonB-dependent receptor [Aestuariicella hydrocarbonica]